MDPTDRSLPGGTRRRLRSLVRVPARALRRALTAPEVQPRRVKRFLATIDPLDVPRSWPQPRSLAIVVPCYGHARYLPPVFETIAAQTRPADEVIFVDDCSPDASAGVIAGFIAAHPDTGATWRVLRNDRNMGQAASLNRGIGQARSDLIMILNDDDYLMHDAVTVAFDRFEAYPELALIGAHSIHFVGEEALAAAPKKTTDYAGTSAGLELRAPVDVLGYRRYTDLNMTHSGSCFRRAAWVVVGGYYPDKSRRIVPFSDRDFQLRVNALWPVGVAMAHPLAFWRADSSGDRELNS